MTNILGKLQARIRVERQARAGDPIEALVTLASSFEQNDGELAGVPTR